MKSSDRSWEKIEHDWAATAEGFVEASRIVEHAVADMRSAFTEIGLRGFGNGEPQSRAERRQQSSPRYQRASRHGAAGQKQDAQETWT